MSRDRPASGASRATAWSVAIVSVLAILVISLTPDFTRGTVPFRWCLVCGQEGAAAGMILNVVFYAPLGFALRRLWGSTTAAVLAGIGLSVVMEAAQLGLPGRFSTLEDLVSNGLGAGLGAFLAVRTGAWLVPDGVRGVATASTIVTLAFLALLVPAPLLTSTVPEGAMYVLWTPSLRSVEQYEGRVLEARVGGLDVPNGRHARPDRIRESLQTGAPIELVFEVGPRPSSLAPVLRVVGTEDVWNEAFQIGADGDDLVLRLRYLADDLRLDRPSFRLRDVLSSKVSGDTVSVVVEAGEARGHRFTVDDVDTVVGVTVGRGWSVLRFPNGLSAWSYLVLDAVWLVGLTLPLGWWIPRSVPWVLVLAGPILALAAIPWLAGFLITPASEYGLVVLGVLGGRVLRGRLGPMVATLGSTVPAAGVAS